MFVEEFIITVYCLIDDLSKEAVEQKKLRQRGFEPDLSNSEVVTMEIVAEFLGINTDKGAWEYFCNHWRSLFSKLGSRANFAKHASNLWMVEQMMHKKMARQLGAFSDPLLHMADGFPMPVCHFKRAYFSRIFRGEAA